ncbi:MAG: succinate dehydrogenase iron-sulfur subunit [Syntrophorhabdaceae bacterium PtaU1.Bin034]|nr:MAG: succinate dehydrogenase iron-sulfur subunit [Syntrophorhabdaceae bacterium PtaU1.Bin034]
MHDPAFLKEMEEKSGEHISTCYQCYRCTNGCPALAEMDLYPHKLIRHIILGNKEKVVGAKTPWACLQCYTCSVRCPNDIDIAHVLNTLRKVAAAEGKGTRDDTWVFDKLFLDNVEKHGRLNETEVMIRYKLAKKNLFDMNDAGMGMRMFLKGRMGLKPHNIKSKADLKKMFEKLKG